MPRPLGQLRILFSARVLLDLEEADKIFHEKGKQAYTDYLLCRGDYKSEGDPALCGARRLGKGPLFDVALALWKLNERVPGAPLVEIGLSCKDEVDSARVIFHNLQDTALGPALEWGTNTAGHPIDAKTHQAFKTDLFLTRNAQDAQTAVNLGVASAVINFPPQGTYDFSGNGPVRLIVDGDAVAFGDSAEVGYCRDVATDPDYNSALHKYKTREFNEVSKPVEPGPFTKVLAKISELNAQFPAGEQPFEIGLLTARGGLSSVRALATLESHGIHFNYPSGFMGGGSKGEWLEAHRPHLFVDDQKAHLERGMPFCPTGLVPYKEGGAMQQYRLEEKAKAAAQAPKVPANDSAASAPVADFIRAASCEGKGCTRSDCKETHEKMRASRRKTGPQSDIK